MGVKTEFEIRFIFDMTRPLPVQERDILLETLGKLGQLRHQRGLIGADVVELERVVRALPVVEDAEAKAEAEAEQIREALRRAPTAKAAADLLGIKRPALYYKMQKYGIARGGKSAMTQLICAGRPAVHGVLDKPIGGEPC